MRITRFAVSLSIALAAAPLMMAATAPTPLAAATSSTAIAASSLLTSTAPFSLVRGSAASSIVAKRFTLTVTIGGATEVSANSYGYIYTGVSGGTAPYTYCFYRNDLGDGCGSYSGRNPYFYAPGTEYFRAVVTDAYGQTGSSPNLFVHIH